MAIMQNFLSSFTSRKASPSPRREPQSVMPNMDHHAVSQAQAPTPSTNADNLTVVELFQSQGCSSCPPANHHVLKLVDNPNVLVLTYEVTYWDYLGWKDTFGSSEFDRRQRAYAQTLGLRNVFTPQVIANGQASGVGSSAKDLQSIMQKSRPLGVVEIQHDTHANMIYISGPANQRGSVNVIFYDPAQYEVAIGRGENGGSTLPHRNVVRRVTSLGQWTGAGGKQDFRIPVPEDSRLRTAVLVQTGDTGAVLGAARL